MVNTPAERLFVAFLLARKAGPLFAVAEPLKIRFCASPSAREKGDTVNDARELALTLLLSDLRLSLLSSE